MVAAMFRTHTDAAEAAIAKAGGGTALARRLSVSPAAVSYWKRRGVPADRVLDVEALTGISRHDLRPDIFGRVEQ